MITPPPPTFALQHWHGVSLAVVVVPLITCAITFGLTIGLHLTNSPLPYISESGEWPPAANVFTAGISISAMIMFIIVILLYSIFKIETEKDGKGAVINRAHLIIGVIVGTAMFGVAAVQYHISHETHLVFAGLCFMGGFIDMVLCTILSWKHVTAPKWALTSRAFLCAFEFVSIVLTAALYRKSATGKILSAFFEIMILASLVVFFASYWFELRRIRLVIHTKDDGDLHSPLVDVNGGNGDL